MGICLIYNINRGKRKTPGSSSVCSVIKRKRERSRFCVCIIPFSRSSLNLGEKTSRLQTTVARVFNSKNNVVRPYDRCDHEIISNNLLLQVNMQQAGVTDKQVGCSPYRKVIYVLESRYIEKDHVLPAIYVHRHNSPQESLFYSP